MGPNVLSDAHFILAQSDGRHWLFALLPQIRVRLMSARQTRVVKCEPRRLGLNIEHASYLVGLSGVKTTTAKKGRLRAEQLLRQQQPQTKSGPVHAVPVSLFLSF